MAPPPRSRFSSTSVGSIPRAAPPRPARATPAGRPRSPSTQALPAANAQSCAEPRHGAWTSTCFSPGAPAGSRDADSRCTPPASRPRIHLDDVAWLRQQAAGPRRRRPLRSIARAQPDPASAPATACGRRPPGPLDQCAQRGLLGPRRARRVECRPPLADRHARSAAVPRRSPVAAGPALPARARTTIAARLPPPPPCQIDEAPRDSCSRDTAPQQRLGLRLKHTDDVVHPSRSPVRRAPRAPGPVGRRGRGRPARSPAARPPSRADSSSASGTCAVGRAPDIRISSAPFLGRASQRPLPRRVRHPAAPSRGRPAGIPRPSLRRRCRRMCAILSRAG